jgi:opacity protein-like surface antigen
MMMTLVLAGLLCPAAASAPAAAASATAAQIRVGGYRAADVNDAGVQAAAQFAAQSVEGELAEVHQAQQQVVAGMNYQLSFSTTDGRMFNAIIFRALSGAYSVTSIEEANGGSGEVAEE